MSYLAASTYSSLKLKFYTMFVSRVNTLNDISKHREKGNSSTLFVFRMSSVLHLVIFSSSPCSLYSGSLKYNPEATLSLEDKLLLPEKTSQISEEFSWTSGMPTLPFLRDKLKIVLCVATS